MKRVTLLLSMVCAACGGAEETSSPLRVLKLEGSPREQGLAHGRALREEIRAWLARVRPADPGVAAFAILTCGARLLEHLPAEAREELAGIAEASGLTLQEVLFLNTRFDLNAFRLGGGAGPGFAGRAEAAPGVVTRWLDPDDLHGHPDDLVLFERGDLKLLGLPGMIGGFLGVRGEVAVALRPTAASGAGLRGLCWTLLVRRLLEQPSAALPEVTLPATIVLSRPGWDGTVAVAPGVEERTEGTAMAEGARKGVRVRISARGATIRTPAGG